MKNLKIKKLITNFLTAIIFISGLSGSALAGVSVMNGLPFLQGSSVLQGSPVLQGVYLMFYINYYIY